MSVLSQKISISVEPWIWKEIKNLKNKSWLINNSLRFYLARKKFIDEAEEKYWNNVKGSLLNNDWKYFSLNSDWWKINEEILESKLWK